MISWLIIVILVVCGIIAIKMNHFRHRMFIILLIFLALFLYGTLSIVNSMNDLELNSSDGVMSAGKLYLGWLANGFGNLKSITGNAIGMDWSSTNASFIDKTNKTEKFKVK